ncbi:transposase [Mangrovibacterium lignilyticum]|uniref:transposase n=1 Tax=Mangrovibacterium lignilyticum TaxID=2668052 RepID=UPI0013D0AA4D|nr:transposase [Mangrovibacterium lignilyticum]
MQVYGIDLSMEKFDVSFIGINGKAKSKQVNNSLAAISKFLMTLPDDCVLCAEHTGVYGEMLVFLCTMMNIRIALVPGYTIKHSFGMTKGKSDPIDSLRIREYGERFADKLTFVTAESENISELTQLYALRAQLVKERKGLQTSEKGHFHRPHQSIHVHRHIRTMLEVLDVEIKAIEQEIEIIIQSDDCIKENYDLARSVKGVGPIIATDLLIKTGNFEQIDTARKASSYAGVCPFPQSSGKMVSKSKTSPFADKKLKSLLFMGAKSAVQHNKEYQLYFRKKMLEGKPYYVIMNNISNKLLRTIYSVVKNKTPYKQDYICLDPRTRKNKNSFSEKVA